MNPESFRGSGLALTTFLVINLFYRGEKMSNLFLMVAHTNVPKTVLSIQQKVGHHWPGSEMPFQWCFTGGLMKAQH